MLFLKCNSNNNWLQVDTCVERHSESTTKQIKAQKLNDILQYKTPTQCLHAVHACTRLAALPEAFHKVIVDLIHLPFQIFSVLLFHYFSSWWVSDHNPTCHKIHTDVYTMKLCSTNWVKFMQITLISLWRRSLGCDWRASQRSLFVH